MHNVRFGLRVPVCSPVTTRDRLIEVVHLAEDLGFDAIFVQDHIHKSFEKHRSSPPGAGSVSDPSNTVDPEMFEMISFLSFAAGLTDRVELGVSVSPLPLRDPILMAKQVATLDALSRGRFVLGVGVSNVTDKLEYQAVGKRFPAYEERYTIASDFVSAMRLIWTEPTVTYHGPHATFDGLTIFPKPARRIPIWLGAASLTGSDDRPPVRFALDHADGFIPPYLTTAADLAASIQTFRATAASAGRDLTGFAWCAQRRLSIGNTVEEARANADWMATEQTDMWKYAGYMHADGASATETHQQMITVGTPPTIRANLQEYVEAGADHIDVTFVYPTFPALVRQIHLFAEQVLPSFR